MRVLHLVLFLLASRDDVGSRRSVLGLCGSTALGVTLLVVAAQADDGLQAGLWLAAPGVDCRLHDARRDASATRSPATASPPCTCRWSPASCSWRFGVEETVHAPGAALAPVPAAALLGGGGLYLLAHVASRWRTVHRVATQRLVAGLLVALVVVEAVRSREQRTHLRELLGHGRLPGPEGQPTGAGRSPVTR